MDDLIDAFIRLMATEDDFTVPSNTGNPSEFTISELAEKVIGLTNSKSGLEFKPLPQDDPVQRQPDITLARKKLGWKPPGQTQRWPEKTITYYESIF